MYTYIGHMNVFLFDISRYQFFFENKTFENRIT